MLPRLLAGELPVHARLMVKYRVAAAGDNEYAWAYVTSWQDQAKALGYAADDAMRDERIRSGRPIVVQASTIIDWAIWTDTGGIIEGGWTNQAGLDLAGHDDRDQRR